MRVLITNTTALNGGDAAILYGTVESLRRAFGPQTSITAFDMQAEAAARHHPGIRFRPSLYAELAAWAPGRLRPAAVLLLAAAAGWRAGVGRLLARRLPTPLRETLATYAAADLVVSSGGTYLVPHYDLRPKLLDYLVTLAMGRPLVLFTQSLGPFPAGRIGRLLRHALRHAALLLVRDEPSRRHLLAAGIRAERIHCAADAAFALAPEQPASRPSRPDLPLRVGISVRDWPHFARRDPAGGMAAYLDAVAALVRHLVERHGARVTFVSTCQGIPDYWTDDARTAEAVLPRLPALARAAVTIDREPRRPPALIERLRELDLLVATRMHAAILALCAGTPVLPIAYEFKTRALFERLGLADLVLDIEDLEGRALIDAAERLLGRREEIGRTLCCQLAELRRSALAAGELTKAALGTR